MTEKQQRVRTHIPDALHITTPSASSKKDTSDAAYLNVITPPSSARASSSPQHQNHRVVLPSPLTPRKFIQTPPLTPFTPMAWKQAMDEQRRRASVDILPETSSEDDDDDEQINEFEAQLADLQDVPDDFVVSSLLAGGPELLSEPHAFAPSLYIKPVPLSTPMTAQHHPSSSIIKESLERDTSSTPLHIEYLFYRSPYLSSLVFSENLKAGSYCTLALPNPDHWGPIVNWIYTDTFSLRNSEEEGDVLNTLRYLVSGEL